MDSTELNILVEAIDGLSSRVMWMTISLAVMYFTFCIGCLYFIFKDDEGPTSSEKESSPLEQADSQLEKGDYLPLEKTCRGILKQRPNNLDANWYLALVLYHQKNFKESLVYFNEVNRINPHWEDSTVAYIKRINLKDNHISDNYSH